MTMQSVRAGACVLVLWLAAICLGGNLTRTLPDTAAARPLAPQSAADASPLETLSQVGGSACCVSSAGAWTLIGVGPRVVVLDTREGSAPVLVGQGPMLDGLVEDIALSEGHAFVAHATALTVLDLSDPTTPTPIARVDVAAAEVRLGRGHHAFVIDVEDRLTVLDVADPASPRVLGTLDQPRGSQVHIQADHAFLLGGGHLEVIDLTSPEAPVPIAGLDVTGEHGGTPSTLALHGDRAYITGWYRFHGTYLIVVDIADPAAPRVLEYRDQFGNPQWMIATEDRLHIAWHAENLSAGITVLDISEDGELAVRARVALPLGVPTGLALDGSRLYVTLDTEGLQVFDIDPVAATLRPAGQWETVGTVTHLAIDGPLAYTLEGRNNWGVVLRVLDVTDPTSPRSLSTLHLGRYGWGLAVAEGHAYVSTVGEIIVVDVRNPREPREAARVAPQHRGLNARSWWMGLTSEAGTLYATTMQYNRTEPQDAAIVLGLEDPMAPAPLAVLELGGRPVDLAVAGARLLVVDTPRSGEPLGDMLRIFDVTDGRPAAPLGQLVLEGAATDVELEGDLAYVAHAGGGISVVAIADPARPVVRGRLAATMDEDETPGAPPSWYSEYSNIALVDEGRTIVTGESIRSASGAVRSLVSVVDVRQPALPWRRGGIEIPGDSRSIVPAATSDGIVWLARGFGGLVALRVQPPAGARPRLFLPALAQTQARAGPSHGMRPTVVEPGHR
jgi:hypothetical protein